MQGHLGQHHMYYITTLPQGGVEVTVTHNDGFTIQTLSQYTVRRKTNREALSYVSSIEDQIISPEPPEATLYVDALPYNVPTFAALNAR